MKRFLIVIFLFFVLPLEAQTPFEGLKVDTTQVTVKRFDGKAIETYQSLREFDYRQNTYEYKPSWFEKAMNWFIRNLTDFFEMLVGVEYAAGIMKFLLQALPYIIGLLFLYLIVKFFVERSSTDFISSAKNSKFKSGSEEEELIKNTDLNVLLHEAISSRNYRNAVRYYYLLALKKLDAENIILWEQQKTNEDFIGEISSVELRASFAENTRLYDFVWYGEFGLTHEEFERAQQDFKTTQSLIKKKNQ